MNQHGHLELIVGPMFSNKSTELIMRVKKHIVKGKTYQAFKPSIDDRYGDDIASHDGLRLPATVVSSVRDILQLTKASTDIVCIDEVQFYEGEIIRVCGQYANDGKIVIVSGLDKDFRDEFFPFNGNSQGLNMSHMINAADEIKYLRAICNFELSSNQICGEPASRSQKFIDGKVAPYDSDTVVVGGKETYAPRCRQHFQFYN